MKKTVSFKKEIIFKTNISEILSIALDKELNLDKNYLKGNFKVYGEYLNYDEKIPFEFEIPYVNYLDECYNISDASVDVSDFYYEVINNKILSVNIELTIDNIEEREVEIME